jgi:hypothetical protein
LRLINFGKVNFIFFSLLVSHPGRDPVGGAAGSDMLREHRRGATGHQ